MPITFSTKVSGPFFTLKGQPLKDAAADTIQDLLKEGEAKLEAQLFPGHGVLTGEYKASVYQKFMRRSRNATGWGKLQSGDGSRALAIRGNWLEGSKRRAEATRFRGYGMFRKTTAHLRRVANVLAGKHYKRAVKRLT